MLEDIYFKKMGTSINKIREEVRTGKEDLRTLLENVFQATSIIITAACVLFIKQPATTPSVTMKQRKMYLPPAIFDDNVL